MLPDSKVNQLILDPQNQCKVREHNYLLYFYLMIMHQIIAVLTFVFSKIRSYKNLQRLSWFLLPTAIPLVSLISYLTYNLVQSVNKCIHNLLKLEKISEGEMNKNIHVSNLIMISYGVATFLFIMVFMITNSLAIIKLRSCLIKSDSFKHYYTKANDNIELEETQLA